MSSKTEIITFNLADRGRKHRGQERTFDTVAAANLINGPYIQEQVKNGDMLGYFGHQVRMKYGLRPVESAIAGGKQIILEPAIRTTRLKAYPDGRVEHQAEFLDTPSGKLAARLYRSKTGGFSSAIDAKRIGNRQVPVDFCGFDYVFEPNFTANRGYTMALDGVFDGSDLPDERDALLDAVNRILDEQERESGLMAATLERLLLENEQLTSMLARAGGKPEIALDGVLDVVTVAPASRLDMADAFLHADLVPYQKPKEEPRPASPADRLLQRRYGV